MGETSTRILVFLLVFVVVAAAELLAPRRPKLANWRARWRQNLALFLLDILAQRLTLGAIAVAAALFAEARGIGLFHWLGLAAPIAAIAGFLLLDLAIYAQHVLTHKVPVLWRLHQVHHADEDVDLTTGLRFHPVEILLSSLWKAFIVLALGIGPWTVIAFEAVLNASALYTHGNWRLPEPLERRIRLLFCTPDMHRVHHSEIRAETDSNYGFFLSVWDRLFGTFRREPEKGQAGVVLGLPEARNLRLRDLLTIPFERRL